MIVNNNPLQHTNINVKKDIAKEKEEVKDKITLNSPSDMENETGLKKLRGNIKRGFEKAKTAFNEGAEKTAEIIDKKPWLDKSIDEVVEFFKTIKAFPRFIYPSLRSMTAREKELVYSTLDKLPLKDVNSVKAITIKPNLADASGMAFPLPSAPYIHLSRDEMNIAEEWAREVITHEVGHTRDYETKLFGLIGNESKSGVWGKGPHISDYAKTNNYEDFAESFANYYRNPEKLKAECPEKYARLQKLEKAGFFEKLVDNEAFRETGKFIGKSLSKVPYLQIALSMITYVTGFLEAYDGLGEMRIGEKTGNEKMKMDGTLKLAAGTCFASKLFIIPGMAIEGAKNELDRAIKNKEITPEQGNAVVQATVGLIAGPVGKAINWVISKLPWHKNEKIKEEKPEEKIKEEKPEETEKAGEEKKVEGSIKKAAGIAAGGATGAIAGGFIGPYLGVMAGFAIGGPIGGVAGLILGAIAGFHGGTRLGGKIGGKIGEVLE